MFTVYRCSYNIDHRLTFTREKMLRERFRKWRINTKNKRSSTLGDRDKDSQPAEEYEKIVSSPSTLANLERPISTNADDVYERRLLSSTGHLLDDSWSTQAGLYEGHRLVNLLITIENAMKLATDAQSPAGWATLQNTGLELKRASWSRISPLNIVYMIRIVGYWSGIKNGMARDLRNALMRYISLDIVGEQHPIATIMNGALTGRFNVETYLKIFNLANAKADAKPLDTEQKESMYHYSRLSYIKILWYFREYKRMEDALNLWTPTNDSDKCYKFRRLAQAKIGLSQYHEAEQFYQAARKTFTAIHQLVEIISGYVWTLVKQNRPEEAVDVFLDFIATYEEMVRRKNDATTQELDIDWLRQEATTLQEILGCDRLTPLIERLRAGSANVVIMNDDPMALETAELVNAKAHDRGSRFSDCA